MSAEAVNPFTAEAVGPAGIDETIAHTERLYRTLTGHQPPPSDAPYAPIPAERDPVRHVEEQLARLMSLLGPTGATAPPEWVPPAALFESDSEALVCLDLPGVGREQLELRLQGEEINIAGRRPSQEPHDQGLRLRGDERPSGRFQRTLPLPRGGNPAAVTARLRDGVLEIRIPKEVNQAATSRDVPIE